MSIANGLSAETPTRRPGCVRRIPASPPPVLSPDTSSTPEQRHDLSLAAKRRLFATAEPIDGTAIPGRYPRDASPATSPSTSSLWMARVLVEEGRRFLFLELRRPPPYCGRDAFGGDHFTELRPEFRLRLVKRADDVEPGINRSAETPGVGAAVDRTVGRVEGFRRNQ